MSNILKVTTPLTDYGNSTKTNPISSNDPNISNVTDVNKVTRYDNKSGESSENQDGNKFLLFQNSNFESFIKILKKMPSTTELMSDLMFVQTRNMVSSGINEDFAAEISQFLEMTKLSKDDLLTFFKSQMQTSTKFSGVFFDFLRSVLSQSNSNELSLRILNLLKKYNDFTSNKHILNSVMIDISNISKNMPARFAKGLIELANHLNAEAATGDVNENTEILKKEIIPYLSKYIKNTNDFGIVRDLISSLSLNTARYENGSKKGFIDAFESLMGYNVIKKQFEGVDIEKFVNFLLNHDASKAENSDLNNKLITILEKGINGEAGYENVDVFKSILSSMLLNESVYMPLVHVMLPLNIDNNMMFSEIWVDPDEEGSQGRSSEGRKTKFLVKFDIKDVGFFDLIILHQKGKVDMQIFCPERILKIDKTIKTGLKEILEKNGLAVSSISVEKSTVPISITEVFPKIYERKNSVNVRV